MIDEKTQHLALPLPHADNLLEGDVERIREALLAVDGYAELVDAVLASDNADLDTVQKLATAIIKNKDIIEQLSADKADVTALGAAYAALDALENQLLEFMARPVLPPMQDNAGKFLSTDGTTAIWHALETLAVVNPPVVTVPAQLPIDIPQPMQMSASSRLTDGSIASFFVQVGQAEAVSVPATNNAANHSIVSGGKAGDMVPITTVAVDNLGYQSVPVTHNVILVAASLKAPVIASPANNATNVAINPMLTLAAPEAVGQTVSKVEVQASTAADFGSIAWTSGETALTNSITAQLAGLNTKYYVRVRYQGSVTGWTEWGAVVGFVTMAATQWDFTGSGSFTVPVSGTYQLECGGGGGGGASSYYENYGAASGSGGGGGYARRNLFLNAGTVISIIVGGGGYAGNAGGNGYTAGGTGGTSSIGSYLSATGGGGAWAHLTGGDGHGSDCSAASEGSSASTAYGGGGGNGYGDYAVAGGAGGGKCPGLHDYSFIYGGSPGGYAPYGTGGGVESRRYPQGGKGGICKITYIGA